MCLCGLTMRSIPVRCARRWELASRPRRPRSASTGWSDLRWCASLQRCGPSSQNTCGSAQRALLSGYYCAARSLDAVITTSLVGQGGNRTRGYSNISFHKIGRRKGTTSDSLNCITSGLLCLTSPGGHTGHTVGQHRVLLKFAGPRRVRLWTRYAATPPARW